MADEAVAGVVQPPACEAEQRAAAAASVSVALASVDLLSQNNSDCPHAVRSTKDRLSLCLKILGIMYKSDEERAERGRCAYGPEQLSHEDKSYLAMVMLNSALLKAMHVAESFQAHCGREFPRAMAEEKDGEFDIDEPPTLALEAGCAASEAIEAVRGEEYRRLQAECYVLFEAMESLSRRRSDDEARIAHLVEDCGRLREEKDRLKRARKAEAAAAKAAAAEETARNAEEVAAAQAVSSTSAAAERFGVTLHRHTGEGGSAVVADSELQRFSQIVQNLTRIVQEARADAAAAVQHADDAARHAADAARERKELHDMLGIEGGDLCTAVLRLRSAAEAAKTAKTAEAARSARRAAERQAELAITPAKIRELDKQCSELEQQCLALGVQNGRLQKVLFEECCNSDASSPPRSSRRSDGRSSAAETLSSHRSLDEDDTAELDEMLARSGLFGDAPSAGFHIIDSSSHDSGTDGPVYIGDGDCFAPGLSDAGIHGAQADVDFDRALRSGPLAGHMDAEDAFTAPELGRVSASASRNSWPAHRTQEASGTSGGSAQAQDLESQRRPFVVCSSSRSHHATASAAAPQSGQQRSLLEERHVAKAALRYAKNPADTQALSKLLGLLKSGATAPAAWSDAASLAGLGILLSQGDARTRDIVHTSGGAGDRHSSGTGAAAAGGTAQEGTQTWRDSTRQARNAPPPRIESLANAAVGRLANDGLQRGFVGTRQPSPIVGRGQSRRDIPIIHSASQMRSGQCARMAASPNRGVGGPTVAFTPPQRRPSGRVACST